MDEKRVAGGGLEKEKVMTTTSARFGPDRARALNGRLIDPLRISAHTVGQHGCLCNFT